MMMTPSRQATEHRASADKAGPSWIELIRVVGTGRALDRETAPKSRDWRDLVADMIVGRR